MKKFYSVLHDIRSASEFLKSVGMKENASLAKELVGIAADVSDIEEFNLFFFYFSDYIISSGVKEQLLTRFLNFLQKCGNEDTYISFFANAPEFLSSILRVMEMSGYFASVLIKNPEFVFWLSDRGAAFDLEADFPKSYKYIKDREYGLAILNKFKSRYLLKIFYEDVNEIVSFEETVKRISALADFIVSMVLEKQLKAEGITDSTFCVVGLGKLGGNELNYSSDIDLIFVYDGVGHDEDNRLKYERAAQKLISELTFHTQEGFLYRVDMRLRPEGESGPLIRTVSGYENYYFSYGETWERQSLLKARRIAGNLTTYSKFAKIVKKYVFSRFDYIEMLEVKSIRNRIYQKVEKGHKLPSNFAGISPNLKLGRGGIRDIEFLVQSLQLFHGIQGNTTLKAIAKLKRNDYLSKDGAAGLAESYIFLRRLEHWLQAESNEQLHSIPVEEAAFAEFCFKLHEKPAHLKREILKHQRLVYSQYQALQNRYLRQQRGKTDDILLLFLGFEVTPDLAEEVLNQYKFKDADKALKILNEIIRGRHSTVHPSADRRILIYKIPYILNEFKKSGDPDAALANFSNILEGLGVLKYGLFREYFNNDSMLKMITKIARTSAYLSRLIIRHPDILESPDFEKKRYASIRAQMEYYSDAPEFKSGELCQQMLNYVLKIIRPPEFQRALVYIARTIIDRVAKGTLKETGLRPKDIMLVCGGKYGSGMPALFSDLDVVYLLSGSEASAASRFFEELTRRLSIYTSAGRLYDVDLRLRPEGDKGALFNPAADFLKYYKERASFWEFLAFSDMTLFFGNKEAWRSIQAAIMRIFQGKKFDWRSGLGKIIALERGKYGKSDFKKGAGGISETDFLMHALKLLTGRLSGSPKRVLQQSTVDGLLSADDARALNRNYMFLRKIELALQVQTGLSVKHLPASSEELSALENFLHIYNLAEQVEMRMAENARIIDSAVKE